MMAVLAICVASVASTSRAEEPASEPTFASRYAAIDAPPAASKEQNAPAGAAPPFDRNDAHASYRALIAREAAQQGLAPEIAEAVMAVESGFNPAARGGAGEIGLMQILPSTARMLGFAGSNAELAMPETNIHLGVIYLARAWRLAGGDRCTAVMKYRAGHGETRFSFLSVNYCVAVRGKLLARGYPLTGSVPVATFGEAAPARGCGRRCLGGAQIGTVNIAALNTRLNAIVAQARAGR
jgi:soluble lytic murein transglycosylase-like protein